MDYAKLLAQDERYRQEELDRRQKWRDEDVRQAKRDRILTYIVTAVVSFTVTLIVLLAGY